MAVNILVLTSPRYHHALRGFAYMFNKYWRSPTRPEVLVASPATLAPRVYLPSNFRYLKQGEHDQYPVGKWSNFLLDTLAYLGWKHFVLFLEDFWLMRPVDTGVVERIYAYCQDHDVLRFDLTADRLYAAPNTEIFDYGFLGHHDIIRSDPASAYHVSTQAAVWNTELLRKILVPNESPWQFEILGTERARLHPDLLVLATRQRPVRYSIVLHGGDASVYHPEGLVPHEGLWPQDRAELHQEGFLTPL
jgi:hypothetical protein